MTPNQVTTWTQTALRRLDDLRSGPEDPMGRLRPAGFILWEEDYPIPISFCDGHATHQGDLRELRDQFLGASKAAIQAAHHTCGENGNPLNVSAQDVFIALYGMIFNAKRV